MAKRKSRAVVSVATGGAGDLVPVKDRRFEEENWPVRLRVTKERADAWMRYLTAEFEARGWSTSNFGQLEARENSGTISARTQTGAEVLDIVWNRKRGGDMKIRARCYPDVMPQPDLEALLEAVRTKSVSGAMERHYRFGSLEYEGLPWKGELWLDDMLRLGPPSQQDAAALNGPRAILVTALVEATGPMDAVSVFDKEIREIADFLSLVMGRTVGRPNQHRTWTWEIADGKTVCSVRQLGYIEPQVPPEMPPKDVCTAIPLYPAQRPQGFHDYRTGLEEELWLPSDVLDLWQHYRALPADRRAKFMQVAAKWQEALIHWQDRDTLSYTLMVVACEALKPSDAAFNDHTIYEVVGALLGPETEARLREHWFRPNNVRSGHVHLGQFHGSELMARTFVDSSYDPTFDQARRELFRVTQDAIIEWLRRRGEFELPRLTKRKTSRRRVPDNFLLMLFLTLLVGIALGWALHLSLSQSPS
jgi:hypothetical protein